MNDLFWNNSGNEDLQPETSVQLEAGADLKFKNLQLKITGFYMDLDDYLRWTPNRNGIWMPTNTENVHNYGIELFADWTPEIFEHRLLIKSNYSYTRSIDEETQNELIYVPKHKAGISAAYKLKCWLISFQTMYSGAIYTSSDNAYKLEGYSLSNLGFEYQAWEKIGFRFDVNNLFNKEYQSLPSRQMPGISFNTSIFIKI